MNKSLRVSLIFLLGSFTANELKNAICSFQVLFGNLRPKYTYKIITITVYVHALLYCWFFINCKLCIRRRKCAVKCCRLFLRIDPFLNNPTPLSKHFFVFFDFLTRLESILFKVFFYAFVLDSRIW